MISRDHKSSLVSALQLSQEMLVAAEDDQWDEVIRKEQDRRRLIEQVLDQSKNGLEQLPELVDQIKKILRLDQRLIDMGIQVKKDISSNIVGLQKNIRVSNAYRSNAY